MFETRDAVRLNVSATGRGRPFVFQHGLGGDAAQTAEVFPEAKGYRRVTLECRGHGLSDAGPTSAISLAQFADDLGAYVESLSEGPVVLGGISMGAALSLMLAVRRPENLRGLVLARPAWTFEAEPANMEPNALAGALLRDHPPERALAAFDQSGIARQLAVSAPDNLKSIRGFFARRRPDVVAALLTRISADGPKVSRDDLARIVVPTLVIGTDEDYVHPFHFAVTIADAILDARLLKVTSKSASRERYVSEFRAGLAAFLNELDA